MTLLALLMAITAFTAHASTPAESLLGDWDFGPGTVAFRITLKDEQDLFVQYCKRDVLLNTHACNADVILYFAFSAEEQQFVHDESSGQHLHAKLQLDPANPSQIHYSFKADFGSGELTGTRLP